MAWRVAAAVFCLGLVSGGVWAETGDGVKAVDPLAELAELRRRLGNAERRMSQLEEELSRSRTPGEDSSGAAEAAGSGGESDCGCRRLPRVYAPVVADAGDEGKCSTCGKQKQRKKQHVVTHHVGYDNGFFIRPFDKDGAPAELKLNGWIQFRHVGFHQDADTWTDNAGMVRPLEDRNYFDIERARLIFSGTAFDPRLTYYLTLDGDTEGADMVDFFDYWWGWRLSDALQLQIGKRKVPGSRNWLMPAPETLTDRPMATDFFRPSRTVGLFAVGDLGETGHFEAMIGDGYRTENLTTAELDTQFAFAGSHWWEPLGDFGASYTDFEWHTSPVVQLGHSLTFAPNAASMSDRPSRETDFVRLTDGTQLTQIGALAPGVTVDSFQVYLYSIDAAVKLRGASLQCEYFCRWIQEIEGDGPLPLSKLYQNGYFVQGSYYLVPERCYAAARVSRVNGLFGDRYEYGAGVAWFVSGNKNLKLSFDVTSLDGSPLNNTTSEILVGDNGVLYRTQFQARF